MKEIVLMFVLALAVFAAPRQTAAAAHPASQASNDSARSPSSKATSHDRHVHRHRSGNHHHRHRTTARSHNS